jgi:hypothetical protein
MTGVAKPSGPAGGLTVLDWAGFKGAASFTFDDNTPSQLPNYNALKATGGRFTWFVVGQWLNGQTSTINQFKATIADGQGWQTTPTATNRPALRTTCSKRRRSSR